MKSLMRDIIRSLDRIDSKLEVVVDYIDKQKEVDKEITHLPVVPKMPLADVPLPSVITEYGEKL